MAPALAPWYPYLQPWDDLDFDTLYWDRWGTYLTNLHLPAGEMVDQALPEGDLEPGGTVAGFLYFERVPDSTRKVAFRFKMMDGKTREAFGSIEIPLTRR